MVWCIWIAPLPGRWYEDTITMTAAEVQTGEAQAHAIANAMAQQRKEPAEIWQALVSSGVDGARAETIVRELFEQLSLPPGHEAFCKKCLDESLILSPGNVSTYNGTGTMFYGDAEQCRTCGSTVRVLWRVLWQMPIIPVGAYRYLQVTSTTRTARVFQSHYQNQFIARRTATRWKQVLTHWCMTLLVILGLPGLLIALGALKRLLER
jgi:hypothetical protein